MFWSSPMDSLATRMSRSAPGCVALAVLLVLAGALQTASQSCLPSKPGLESPVLQDKVSNSDLVIKGVVERRTPHSRESGGYISQVRVLCVYKGGPSPPVLNVSYAGILSGTCVRTRLQPKGRYLVYLKRQDNDVYLPTFTEDPAEPSYLDELSTACGVSLQYPQGVSRDTAQERCEDDKFSADYDEGCKQQEMSTTLTPGSAASKSARMRREWGTLSVLGVVCLLIGVVLGGEEGV